MAKRLLGVSVIWANHPQNFKVHFLEFMFSTKESFSQTTVELMVTETDKLRNFSDRGKHGETRVEIVGGVSDFLLQSYGGGSLNVIKVSSLAKFRRGHVYNLTLKATDFGTPPRASVASLTIKVITLHLRDNP